MSGSVYNFMRFESLNKFFKISRLTLIDRFIYRTFQLQTLFDIIEFHGVTTYSYNMQFFSRTFLK